VKIHWTGEAIRWLQEINGHIASDNPEAAKRTIAGIRERVQILRTFPRIGYQYQDSVDGIRILHFGHYRIAYLIRSDIRIEILGIFHGSLDLKRFL